MKKFYKIGPRNFINGNDGNNSIIIFFSLILIKLYPSQAGEFLAGDFALLNNNTDQTADDERARPLIAPPNINRVMKWWIRGEEKTRPETKNFDRQLISGTDTQIPKLARDGVERRAPGEALSAAPGLTTNRTICIIT